MAHATTHAGTTDDGDTGAVLAELIAALEEPGAIDAAYAAQLAEQLTLLLEHHRRRQRLLALDAREVAIRGVPGDSASIPSSSL